MINIEYYYYVIICVGLFIMFALVGYLVEIIKKNKWLEKINDSVDNSFSDSIKKDNNETELDNIKIESEEISIDNDILNK